MTLPDTEELAVTTLAIPADAAILPLATTVVIAADRHPALVYLARLAPGEEDDEGRARRRGRRPHRGEV